MSLPKISEVLMEELVQATLVKRGRKPMPLLRRPNRNGKHVITVTETGEIVEEPNADTSKESGEQRKPKPVYSPW